MRSLPLVLLLPLAACAPSSSGLDGAQRPSIVLISLDTLRADLLGIYGYQDHPTSPFLDSFAEQCVIFDRSFVTEPRTLTSHMTLMTGLYPQRHGVQDETTLAADIPTLAGLLQEQGYATQAFVDGGYLNRRWGFARGFDGYVGDEQRGLETIVAEAQDWLRAHDGRPFFLFLHAYDVHADGRMPDYQSYEHLRGSFSGDIASELNQPDTERFKEAWSRLKHDLSEADKQYIKATYAEGVRQVDELLEGFFGFLEENGLYDSSVIFVWSDHGEGLCEHKKLAPPEGNTSSYAWGHGNVYEYTIHVPLLLKLPAARHAGKRIGSVVSSIDIAPTILELAGRAAPSSMDGSSMLGLLEDDTREGLAFSIRVKGKGRLFTVRSSRYRLIWDAQTNRRLFFDTENDPLEQNDLYPSGLPEEAELSDALHAWVAEYDQARAAAAGGEQLPVDEEIRDQLRALGYIR
jgi:arylsulfatase A-like enzyme